MTKKKLRKTKESLGAESGGHGTAWAQCSRVPCPLGGDALSPLTDERRRLPILRLYRIYLTSPISGSEYV